ncbi:DUF2570 family protein [Serratia aquatilis]|uniref:DUF2570 family protein n=1 Tax=Serratia aquatilis TaxID=1737515 RepID=A0ABV6E9H0_9GAMM
MKYGLIGALLVAICLGWYSSVLTGRLETSQQLIREQSKSLEQQSALIGTMQIQDAQNRSLMAAQLQQEQQLRQRATANERKFREAIKNDDCAKRDMPGAVVELLQPLPPAASTETVNPATP